MFVVFCFKQKTAYEMRISDWSSDVCSSDLETPSAGIIYFPARFKGRLGASWSRDGFTASSAVNHVSGVTNNLLATPVKGGSMTTLDLVLDYQADFSRI